ncbi:uncharacterized protein LOC126749424 [Anthonomus grandis grandis]|uniref:uncharacterized protein LOC126749424 n=1 Tax=Anthonomus grandis grandis TaxID=2921223 RepID=UPI0021655685|nr:uncharacterized protein LOC126749424 [Anthonomus grandis grandis]XP_050315075.1 uncharacterized protein LOC126749424 [Anthonomus grandis grandis]XP_050315076.1 uncharacterized protein LOC126749424 [Anthonomus grandis grandis]
MPLQVPNVILYLVVALILPLLAVIALFLFIFRQLVDLYLKVTLKEKYGGLLCAADKVYAKRIPANPLVMFGCSYVRTDTKVNLLEKFRNYAERNILGNADEYLKLTSTLHCFLGQAYLQKETMKVEEIAKPIPLPQTDDRKFNEEYLKESVALLYSAPLPRNNTALFDVFVSTEPLEDFHPSVKGYVYPMMFRMHHSVADGARCITLIAKCWADEKQALYSDQLTLEEKRTKNTKNIIENIISLARESIALIQLLITGTVAFLKASFLKECDDNIIHPEGRYLCGDKLIAWQTETESCHVQTVKDIKNRIPNTKFSDVIFYCISAAMTDYFTMKNVCPPEKISCILPFLIFKPSVNEFRPRDLKSEFTFITIDLSLVNPSNGFTTGIEKVKTNLDEGKNSVLKDFIYLTANYLMAVIPTTICPFVFDTSAYTAAISNVPGCEKFKFLGHDVLSLIISAPNTNQTGLTITVLTLDNKFNICLFADKAIIQNQEDGQFIVDRVVRNIEILNEESKQIFA